MKNIIKAILPLIAVYLAASFIMMDLNASNWSLLVRSFAIVGVALAYVLYPLILFLIED